MYANTKPKRKREEVPSAAAAFLNAGAGLWHFSQRATSKVMHWIWLVVKWFAYGTWAAIVGLGHFSRRVVSKLLRWAWVAVKWSAIGTWRGFVWLMLFTWAAVVWLAALPGRLLRGFVRWWQGPEPYFESERERDIYQRIRRQFRRRNRFRLHSFAFLTVNTAFWIQWFNMSGGPYAPSLWNYLALTVVTAFFLLFHFFQMRSAIAEDAALENALNEERHYNSLRYARLSDDGEIVDDYYLEEEWHKRKRQ